MKKTALIFIPGALYTGIAIGDCTNVSNYYSSCKPGYYLSSNKCSQCPLATNINGSIRGTTPDKNTGDITSCYLPSGTYSDTRGTFSLNGNCYYAGS